MRKYFEKLRVMINKNHICSFYDKRHVFCTTKRLQSDNEKQQIEQILQDILVFSFYISIVFYDKQLLIVKDMYNLLNTDGLFA